MTGAGDRVLDSFLDRPAALTGILGIARDLRKLRILLEGVDKQIEQPRTYDGSFEQARSTPGTSAIRLSASRSSYPLGIRLHQAVFDAVVHHLRVMTSTDGTGVDKAVCSLTVGAKGVEDRIAFSTSGSDPPTIRP